MLWAVFLWRGALTHTKPVKYTFTQKDVTVFTYTNSNGYIHSNLALTLAQTDSAGTPLATAANRVKFRPNWQGFGYDAVLVNGIPYEYQLGALSSDGHYNSLLRGIPGELSVKTVPSESSFHLLGAGFSSLLGLLLAKAFA
jgi:hypothetical protein